MPDAQLLTPARAVADRRLLAAILVVTLLTAMDQTIVATALPSIVRDLGGERSMGWVFAGYTLAMTLSMPVYGRLGDLRGRRSLFLGCLVAFVVASAACALAATMGQLVGLRAVQGLAGGGVLVLSQAVVADAVPARDRGRFMAPVGLVFATASIIGPLVGGTLTDTLGWRWVFWVNLPLGLVTIALATWSVPRPSASRPTGRLDVPGALVYAVAVTGVVILTSRMGERPERLTPADLVTVALTALAAGAFIRRMVSHPDPLIPLGVLQDRTVGIASWLGFTIGVAVFAMVGYLPTIVQTMLDVRATASGALLLALILGMMLTVFGSARWIARTGRYRRLPVIGSIVAAAAMMLLAGLDTSWGLWRTALCVAVLGCGVGCFMQLVTTMAQEAAPAELVGSATSTVSLVRELGVTIGAATIGSVLAAGTGTMTLFITLGAVLALGGLVSLLLPHRVFAPHEPGAPLA